MILPVLCIVAATLCGALGVVCFISWFDSRQPKILFWLCGNLLISVSLGTIVIVQTGGFIVK